MSDGKSYVYLLRVGPYFKIGKSRDPKKRIAQLTGTGTPDSIDLVATVETISDRSALNIESQMHRLFDGFRTRGEWFSAQPVILNFFLGLGDCAYFLTDEGSAITVEGLIDKLGREPVTRRDPSTLAVYPGFSLAHGRYIRGATDGSAFGRRVVHEVYDQNGAIFGASMFHPDGCMVATSDCVHHLSRVRFGFFERSYRICVDNGLHGNDVSSGFVSLVDEICAAAA